MTCFVDVTCSKCQHRFGWLADGGEDITVCACPKCGNGDRLSVHVQTGSTYPRTGDGIFRARRASGLSFSQAVRDFGVTRAYLGALEDGTVQPSRNMWIAMAAIYACTWEEDTNPKEEP